MIHQAATASYSDPYDTDQDSGSDSYASYSSDVFAASSTSTMNTEASSASALAGPGASYAPAQAATVNAVNVPAISPLDINQGEIGDCYALAALGELGLVSPSAIQNMIHDNGNGTYTVTLDQESGIQNLTSEANNPIAAPGQTIYTFAGGQFTPITVTVSDQFNPAGSQYMAQPTVVNGTEELWPLILEEAYAEAQCNDPSGANLPNDYNLIGEGGYAGDVWSAMNGQPESLLLNNQAVPLSVSQLQTLVAQGDMIAFDTPDSFVSGVLSSTQYNLIGAHVYMFDGLTTVGGQSYVEVLNPWGLNFVEGGIGGDYQPNLIPIAQLGNAFEWTEWSSLPSGDTASLSPTVNGIQLQASSASLSAGQTVTIDLTWSDAITVAPGSVSLALSDGGVATYVSGSGTNTLQFSYTVASAESISSLSVLGINEAGEYGVNFYDLTDMASGQQASTYFTGMTQTDDVTSNTLSLSGTNNNENVSGYTISMAADSGATISGGTNSISVGDGSTLTLTGSSNTVSTGNSDTITDNTGGNSVAVSGSNDIITASSDTVSMSAGDTGTNVIGSSNTIDGTSGDVVTVTGANNTIDASSIVIGLNGGDTGTNVIGAGDTIYGTSGDAVTVTGANNVVNASGVTIALSAGDTGTNVIGSSNTIDGTSGDVVTVTGAGNTINASGIVIGLNAGDTGTTLDTPQTQLSLLPGDLNGDGMVNFQDLQLLLGSFGQPGYDFHELQMILGEFGESGPSLVQLMGGNAGTNITGSNDTIYGTGNDAMTVTGTNDTINASNVTIGLYLGDNGTNVVGSNDTIDSAFENTLTLTGNSNAFYGSNDTITFTNNSIGEQIDGSSDVVNAGTNDSISLSGSSGSDTIAFSNTPGFSTVSNFNTASDVLQFNQTLFANYAAAMSDATQVGANTVFAIDGSDSVTLVGVTKNTLTTSNFHFAAA